MLNPLWRARRRPRAQAGKGKLISKMATPFPNMFLLAHHGKTTVASRLTVRSMRTVVYRPKR
jgi:hypothetical protein